MREEDQKLQDMSLLLQISRFQFLQISNIDMIFGVIPNLSIPLVDLNQVFEEMLK
ncbi:unnamed protein product, partial [marine sediment metagenome]